MRRGFTIREDGLKQKWEGRAYVNPPYGPEAWPFLAKLAEHRSGIALIFARTETKLFSHRVWQEADSILFLLGRLTFYRPDGTKGAGNSGGPSILIAYSKYDTQRLAESGLAGSLVTKWDLQKEAKYGA